MSKLELFTTKYVSEEYVRNLSEQMNEPKWLLERRLNAYKIYQDLPFDKDTLFYKYTNFRKFDPQALPPAWEVDNADAAGELSDDIYVKETGSGFSFSQNDALKQKGVIVSSIHDLISQDEELAKKIVDRVSFAEDYDKLGALARALAKNVLVVYVPKNVLCEHLLVKISEIAKEEHFFYTELIVYLEEGSALQYIDLYEKANDTEKTKLFISAQSIYVGENAHLSLANIQNWDLNTVHIQTRKAYVGNYGNIKAFNQLQGSEMTRISSDIILEGNGSEGYDLYSSFGSSKQRFDVKSNITHAGRDTIGQVHARTVMMDKAESILRGMMILPEPAVNADSWLSSRGMTIGNGKVIAIPALAIDQNDIKAAHSASVEPLNEDALFYIETRGIPRADAKEILIKGFLNHIAKMFKNIKVENLSEDYLDSKWKKVEG